MSSYPYNILPGHDITEVLQFAPTSVIVSNYSPYYIYFPDGLTFCPPWTAGAIIPLAHAVGARLTWSKTPFGDQVIPVAPARFTYQAAIQFTDDNVGQSGGTNVESQHSAQNLPFWLPTSGPPGPVPAGTYQISGFFPPAITISKFIMHTLLDPVVNANDIGLVRVYLQDDNPDPLQVQTADIVTFMARANGDPIVLDWPNPLAFPRLYAGGLTWTLVIVLFDITAGPCQYYVTTTMLYNI